MLGWFKKKLSGKKKEEQAAVEEAAAQVDGQIAAAEELDVSAGSPPVTTEKEPDTTAPAAEPAPEADANVAEEQAVHGVSRSHVAEHIVDKSLECTLWPNLDKGANAQVVHGLKAFDPLDWRGDLEFKNFPDAFGRGRIELAGHVGDQR